MRTKPRRPEIPAERAPADPPRVWAVLSDRAGDDAQILALARALGWPFEMKRLAYRAGSRFIDVWRGSNLLGIDRRRSSELVPPWPDLVVSASMRNEPVCRWIRAQSPERTRYVHIGKPWADLSRFDLVITVPEYRWLPDHPRLLRNPCSLHEITPERLRDEVASHAHRIARHPGPYVAVLVGGYAGPYPFDRLTADRLGRAASTRARALGASLLVTTSKRTSRAATEALRAAIDVPFTLFDWSAAAGANPHLAFLGAADEIIVTGDSTSMLAEACATRKPVHIFDLEPARDAGTPLAVRARHALGRDRVMAFLYRHGLLRLAPTRLRRDISRVHDALIEAKRAVWLGDAFPEPAPAPLDAMPQTVARVRELLASDPRGGPT